MANERDAIERLEGRVELLEAIVRKLAAASPTASPASSRLPAEPKPTARPGPPPSPQPTLVQRAETRLKIPDLEQWVGQRGLLVVGVIALLVAAGLFLKYAFEQGWIAPGVRVAGAVAAGVGMAAWGDRLIRRGMRRYGAAIVGAGGGLAYLGVWAAAGPYELVSRLIGVGLLAVTTGLVAWLAIRRRIEGLATWAVVGAYFAPVVLPEPTARPEALLGYVAIVGACAGFVAHRRAWRAAFGTVLLGYFLLPTALVPDVLRMSIGLAFLAVGGVAALGATAGRGWAESRLGGFLFAWGLLLVYAAQGASEAARWTAVAAGVPLLSVPWWQQRGTNPLARLAEQDLAKNPEGPIFLLGPVAFVGLAWLANPAALRPWAGAVPAATAAWYLADGWPRRAAHSVAMGIALLGLAVVGQWDGVPVAVGWTVLLVAAVVADRWLDQPGGRPVAVALALLVFVKLIVVSRLERPAGSPAFVDAWALALYLYVLSMGACARWWRSREPDFAWSKHGREVLWTLCAAAVFCGGTVELNRFFDARHQALARDLASSAFWLVYAGVLVRLGFLLENKPVRSAGLAVAGLAGLKVVLYDLSTLEALYRVGSFFALALITLAVAYAYNRRAKASA